MSNLSPSGVVKKVPELPAAILRLDSVFTTIVSIPSILHNNGAAAECRGGTMKVFATRVWGFDPGVWPVITFGLEGNRDWLLQNSSSGDRIVFVGTQGAPTSESERGRLLGMAEIGRRAVDTLDVIRADIRNPEDYDEQGNFKWP
jgi:hypothetical protein